MTKLKDTKVTVCHTQVQLYFARDRDRVRIGRMDWAGDQFEIVPAEEFEVFRRICACMQISLMDVTEDDAVLDIHPDVDN